MKKLIVFALVFFALFMKMPEARVNVESVYTGHTYFTSDNVQHKIYLYQDKDTKRPIFPLSFETDVNKLGIKETESLSYTEEELNYIKSAIAILTNGESFNDVGNTKLLGIQALLWDLWANKTGATIRYNFDVAYGRVDYKKKVENTLPTYNTPIEYHLSGTVNEPIYFSLFSLEKEDYQFLPMNHEEQIMKHQDGFSFIPKQAKIYDFKVQSSALEEQIKYFIYQDVPLIEVTKGKSPDIYLHIESKEKMKDVHTVRVITSDGVTLRLDKTQFLQGEKVQFTPILEEGYQLKQIKATTIENKEIVLDHFSFIMPDEAVILEVEAKKIPESPTYTIFYQEQEGMIWNKAKSVQSGQKVMLDYSLEKEYQLVNIEVFTLSGKKLPLEGQSFVMPAENIVILVSLQKKKEIEQEEKKGAEKEEMKEEIKEELLENTFDETMEVYSVPKTYQDTFLFPIRLLMMGCLTLFKKK